MRGQGRPRGRQKRLAALLPSGAGGTAARTPFVLLIVVLLGSGLITLLLLNSALNQGSFELSKLEKKTDELTDEQQALQQDVDAYSAPGALERRARRLGMVPGGSPAFLLPDGTVRGRTSAATSEGAPLSTSAEPSLLGATGRTAPSAPPRPQAPPVEPPAVRQPVPAAAGAPGPDSAAPAPGALAPPPSAAPVSLVASGSDASPAPAPAPGAAAALSPTTSGR
ncbi:septum formation initiator family protein [Streptomyces decoyicus]|uniref:septum formation initiator family protein n=1 Tax=Streptomyces decoyicus TaxID=249567 RepID=UPI00069F2BE1|nr:septum formation initiator family protein [Streptomyces decoyicus]KOG48739.1 membrane protein [Streptomyces decoyicus]QZY15535.1 septum formation initiator family protein [Streptomyces decoyicus]